MRGVNSAISQIRRLPGATRGATEELDKIYKNQYFQVRDLGMAFGGLATAIGGAFAYAVDSAVQWESAMADVQKTTGSSDAELGKISDQLFELASRKPIPSADLADIAAEAGALGLRGEDIAAFTSVVADLAATTNMTADDATVALARIGNIVGVTGGDYERMGSTILELGRSTAATETEISNMSKRIAGAGKTVGLTADQIFAYSAALASVGVREEQGGSAISRTFIDIASAVSKGGEDLNLFAQVAGMSADQFKAAFAEDAAGTTAKFIDGLGQIQDAGGNVFGVLESLGITEVRQRDAILRLASAHGLLDQTLGIGAQAWQDNSALAEIANKRYQTAAAQLAILKNQAFELAAGIGDTLLPVFKFFVSILSSLVFGLQALPGPLKFIYAAAFALIGVVAALGVAFVFVGPRIRLASQALKEMAVSAGITSTQMTVLRASLGWVSAALTLATVALAIFGMKQKEASENTAAWQAKIDKLNQAIDQNARGNNNALKAWVLQETQIEDVIGAMEKYGITQEQVLTAMAGNTFNPDTGTMDFADAYTDIELKLVEAKKNSAGATEEERKALEELDNWMHNVRGTITAQESAVAANNEKLKEAGILTQADAEAQQRLADEYEKTKEQIDNQNQALIALVDAQRQQRQAENSLVEAKLKVEEAAYKLAHAADYQRKAELELAQAQQGVLHAERDVAKAEQELADARQKARDKVRDAELSLLDAQDRQYDSRQKIKDAEEAYQKLKGADYQLEVRKATNALADAYSKLHHAQQDVEDAQWQINYLMEEGASARDIADAQQALVDANNGLADSQVGVIDATNELNDLTDPVKVAERLAEAQHEVEKAYRDAQRAAREVKQATEELTQARADLTNDILYKEAQEALTDAQLRVVDANLQVQTATLNLQNLQSGQLERDYTNAQLGLEDAYYRLATANVEVQKQQALSRGEIWTSEDAVNALRNQLWAMAGDASGPISDHLRMFGGTLVANTLPRNIPISVDTSQAVNGLDGLTNTANQKGDEAGKEWYNSFMEWVGSGLSTALEKVSPTNWNLGGGADTPWVPWASGGVVDKPTLALIGEAGKELILPLSNMNRTFQLLREAGLMDAMKKKLLTDMGTSGMIDMSMMQLGEGGGGTGGTTNNNVRHGDKWNLNVNTVSDSRQIAADISWKRRVKTRR